MKASEQNKDMKRLVSLFIRKWRAELYAEAANIRVSERASKLWSRSDYAKCVADAAKADSQVDLCRHYLHHLIEKMLYSEYDPEDIILIHTRLVVRYVKGTHYVFKATQDFADMLSPFVDELRS